VIGFLRTVGILNAAVWFGASIFFTLGAGPAVFSQEMEEVLKLMVKPNFYQYSSGAIAQVLVGRYFHLQLACSIVALLHLLAERLYFGKSLRSFWVNLLIGLFALNLLGGCVLQPKLKQLHTTKYSASTRPDDRKVASDSFAIWHGVSQAGNLLMMGGLAVYLWRLANPADSTRVVSTAKFWG